MPTTPIRYIREYRALARQLAFIAIGREWFQRGVPVAEAAAWANLGFMPDEAAPLIAAGVTPELHRAVEEAICPDADERAALHLQLMCNG